MKKSAEMKQQLAGLKNQLQEVMNGTDPTVITNKTNEIKALQAQIEAQELIEEDETKEFENKAKRGNDNMQKQTVNYSDVFLKKIRNMALQPEAQLRFNEEEIKALSSNTDADGRLLIPQDLQTKIKELKREYLDMYNYVNVEPVSTATGHRVIEQEAENMPFDGVAELVTIPDMGSPKFAKVAFAIQDFKGLIEIPNSLLKDEKADLMTYLAKWIAKKLVATHNALLFYANGTNGTQGILGVTADGFTIETLDSKATVTIFKGVLNKKLPSYMKKTAKIFTNQTGFDYLDSLETTQGVPLLQPDPTDATKYRFLGKEVVVFDDNVLKNDATGNAPFIIGNAVEGMTYFDREGLSLASSSEAGFDNDSTKVRAISRGDSRIVDKKALHVLFTPVV